MGGLCEEECACVGRRALHPKKNGSEELLSLSSDNSFRLCLKEKDENGKSKVIKPRQTFLQCTSYFPNYDGWDIIMQNRGKTGDAQVDHVLQENEANVDIQCLDLVTKAENLHRKSLDPKNKKTVPSLSQDLMELKLRLYMSITKADSW